MIQALLPPGTQTCTALCPTCRLSTTFRAVPGRSWFCTVCGTPHDPQPVVVRQHHNSVPGIILASVLGVVVLLWGAGMLLANAQIYALCTGDTSACTLTVSNGGFWPLRIDPNSVHVDGHAAQIFGSGLAGPFDKSSVKLFTANGDAITTGAVFSYSVGTVFGPISWQQTVNLSTGKQ